MLLIPKYMFLTTELGASRLYTVLKLGSLDLAEWCSRTTMSMKTEKEMDWRRQVQHGGLAAHGGRHRESCWMEKENPCGWPLAHPMDSQPEGEREAHWEYSCCKKLPCRCVICWNLVMFYVRFFCNRVDWFDFIWLIDWLIELQDQDPAVFSGEMARASREVLLTRYRLLPFLYTLMHFAHVDGSTVARPLFHEYATVT